MSTPTPKFTNTRNHLKIAAHYCNYHLIYNKHLIYQTKSILNRAFTNSA